MKTNLLAIALIVLSAFVLAARGFGGTAFTVGACAGFFVLCLIGLSISSIREVLLLLGALVLSAIFFSFQGPIEIFIEAVSLAAFFATFILLLTALKIAAERSQSILAVGRYLIRQPASGRYIATALGGHCLGVFLNFGAISMLAPMIQNAAKDEHGNIDEALERRQISALLRGFAWILLWAPTTLTQAVVLTLFTNISYGKIIALGVATSILMMIVGFRFDRIEWRNASRHDEISPPFPKTSFWRLSFICCCLIVATATLQICFGLSTALSLMYVAPVVTILWFSAQKPAGFGLSRQLATFWPALTANAPGLARSAMALGLSGFIGRMLAEIVPVEAFTSAFDVTVVPGWAFLAILPVLITLGGQIALSPIILVVFVGQIIQTMPDLPADPTNIVFALSAGWALSMFASPNATATLLISATTSLSPTKLTWSWNLKYGTICYILLVAIFVLLEV
ncbi:MULTISPECIES: hypothetical protein [Halocynthiibacter]|uniref:Uncharacterized protein n=1 Tax=Halocynthiibacter halioticoli TaxID=2986804 RepID=A0AAE3IZF5_9RHOB|nr:MULTISPECIES: hypothetical protein [Halocynthiibacter]MCV6824844.1 hypothetical protein [Halocynthiibacter halioticoli]MCW4057845.1 hypothetical protein [Halocynthiibacter sp. SDUM655004]